MSEAASAAWRGEHHIEWAELSLHSRRGTNCPPARMARPAVLDSFSHFPHINTRLVHIYIACSRQVPATAAELISSGNCEHFLRGALSLLPAQEFVVGVARPPARTASTSWIGCRAGHRASTVRRLCVGSLVREYISQALVSSCAARSIFTCHYEG